MDKGLFKKTMRGIIIGLAILTLVLIVTIVRFEIYVPELINRFLLTIGG